MLIAYKRLRIDSGNIFFFYYLISFVRCLLVGNKIIE
jgi:hypothetical protein